MKNFNWKIFTLGAAALAFYGCEQNEEMLELSSSASFNMSAGSEAITFETVQAGTGEVLTEIYTESGFGPIAIYNKARNSDGVLLNENRAMVFDTGMPTGDDDDLHADWGNVLIIQEIGVNPIDVPGVEFDGPNDNRWGGEMELTFPEAVTVKSLRVLDIDTYEDDSWVHLMDMNGNEVASQKLQPLGNNSKQMVTFNGTEGVAGVVTVKVTLNGTGENKNIVGSGAIDNIAFVVPVTEEPGAGCTRTQGYWKNHADPNKKQYNSTWDAYLNAEFYNSGLNYLAVLNTSPKGGNAYLILAHQYIAAKLNMESGATSTTEVSQAMAAAKAYFESTTGYAEPKDSAMRAQLIKWAELLDAYNNGVVGPGHCDE